MTEYEVYELVISLQAFQHSLGEAILLQIQFWVGVSFAFIAMTFIAPERLTRGVVVFLLAIYASFTAATYMNSQSDLTLAQSSYQQSEKLLAENENATFVLRVPAANQQFKLSSMLAAFFLPGLFIGVIVYVSITARKTHVASKRESVSSVSDT
jgi:Ca2+/Na+ antiporter